MNQEKIGKFIKEQRKKKKITQLELAEKLGVTDRSVGNWENGRCMPDLSLFKPLCEILGISINELIIGGKTKNMDEKYERNIIKTIEYSSKEIKKNQLKTNIFIMIIGIIIILFSFIFMNSEKSTPMICSIIGLVIMTMGFYKMINQKKKLIYSIIFFTIAFLICFLLDFLLVVNIRRVPIFRYKVVPHHFYYYKYDSILYKTYQVNRNIKDSEYLIVDTKNQYNENNLPISIFNRDLYSLEKNIKNHSNKEDIFYYRNNLPLNECSISQDMDDKSKINFECSNMSFDNDNTKYRKAFLYSSVVLFLTHEKLNKIVYDMLGDKYIAYRENYEENYPNFKEINVDNFNELVERKMYNTYFINKIFDKVFTGKYLGNIFIRTYKVLDIEQGNIPYTYSLTLSQYNKETSRVYITELEKELEVNKNYEFVLQPEVSTNYIDESIESIFKNSRILEVYETEKEGEEQTQEKINRYIK